MNTNLEDIKITMDTNTEDIIGENKMRIQFLNNEFNEKFIKKLYLYTNDFNIKNFNITIEDHYGWNIVMNNISWLDDDELNFYPNIYCDIKMYLDETYILKLRDMLPKINKVNEKLRLFQDISKPKYCLIIKEYRLITTKIDDLQKIFKQHNIDIIINDDI